MGVYVAVSTGGSVRTKRGAVALLLNTTLQTEILQCKNWCACSGQFYIPKVNCTLTNAHQFPEGPEKWQSTPPMQCHSAHLEITHVVYNHDNMVLSLHSGHTTWLPAPFLRGDARKDAYKVRLLKHDDLLAIMDFCFDLEEMAAVGYWTEVTIRWQVVKSNLKSRLYHEECETGIADRLKQLPCEPWKTKLCSNILLCQGKEAEFCHLNVSESSGQYSYDKRIVREGIDWGIQTFWENLDFMNIGDIHHEYTSLGLSAYKVSWIFLRAKSYPIF